MAVVGRPPAGKCPRCGDGNSIDINSGGRRRCLNCEHVWTCVIADGGVAGPDPTDVSVHPETCKQLRRLSQRGPDVEAIAALFDIPVGVVEYHLSVGCECPDNERSYSDTDDIKFGGESS